MGLRKLDGGGEQVGGERLADALVHVITAIDIVDWDVRVVAQSVSVFHVVSIVIFTERKHLQVHFGFDVMPGRAVARALAVIGAGAV
jgi:hypothetical protein